MTWVLAGVLPYSAGRLVRKAGTLHDVCIPPLNTQGLQRAWSELVVGIDFSQELFMVLRTGWNISFPYLKKKRTEKKRNKGRGKMLLGRLVPEVRAQETLSVGKVFCWKILSWKCVASCSVAVGREKLQAIFPNAFRVTLSLGRNKGLQCFQHFVCFI